MVVFKLTMPDKGGHPDTNSHIVVKHDNQSTRHLIGKSFSYLRADGEEIHIDVLHFKATDPALKKLKKNNVGLGSYQWMVTSILTFGEIRK